MVQQGDGLVRRLVDGELDVRQHLAAPALGHEQRAALPGGVEGEALGVDEPDPGVHRIDTEPGEGQVEEGDRGMDHDRHLPGHDPGILGQQGHRALGHRR